MLRDVSNFISNHAAGVILSTSLGGFGTGLALTPSEICLNPDIDNKEKTTKLLHEEVSTDTQTKSDNCIPTSAFYRTIGTILGGVTGAFLSGLTVFVAARNDPEYIAGELIIAKGDNFFGIADILGTYKKDPNNEENKLRLIKELMDNPDKAEVLIDYLDSILNEEQALKINFKDDNARLNFYLARQMIIDGYGEEVLKGCNNLLKELSSND